MNTRRLKYEDAQWWDLKDISIDRWVTSLEDVENSPEYWYAEDALAAAMYERWEQQDELPATIEVYALSHPNRRGNRSVVLILERDGMAWLRAQEPEYLAEHFPELV